MAKKDQTYTITGTIVGTRAKTGVPRLRVEAWDKDLIFDDFVGSAVTDALGAFVIKFARSRFQELFLDREPDLYFKVFDGETLIKSTEDSVLWNIKSTEQSVEIQVDIPETPPGPDVPRPGSKYEIKGRIADDNGLIPIANLRIQVWDVESDAREVIASTISGAHGEFVIELDKAKLEVQFGARTPQLRFSVYRGDQQLLGPTASPVWSASSPDGEITIVLGSGKPDMRPVTLVSKEPGPEIAEVLHAASIQDKAVMSALISSGVNNLRDLFRGGPDTSTALLGLKDEDRLHLLAVARFAVAAQDLALGARLADAGITSFTKLASMPALRIERALGTLTGEDRTKLQWLLKTARFVHRQTQDFAVTFQRRKSWDGGWFSGRSTKDIRKSSDQCSDCSCCNNAFSPRAYLFDLLQLIDCYWSNPSVPPHNSPGLDLSVETLEKLFLQPILDLSCDAAMRPIPQVCLSAQVLEKLLGSSIPPTDQQWANNFRTEFTSMFGLDRIPMAVNHALAARLKNLVETASPSATTCEEIYALLKTDPHGLPDAPARQELEYFAKRLDDAAVTRLFIPYRDKLIAMTGQDEPSLERNLFIDLQTRQSQTTTRIGQLILCAQSFILAIRTGEIAFVVRPDLDPQLVNFQLFASYPVEEMPWQWLSNYTTWLAGRYTLVYPENVLPPPLDKERDGKSPDFKAAIDALRQNRIDPFSVRHTYLNYAIPQDALDSQGHLRAFQDALRAGIKGLPVGVTNVPEDLQEQSIRLWKERTRSALMETWDGEYGASPYPLANWITDVNSTCHDFSSLIPLENRDELQLPIHDQIEQGFLFPLLAGWALNRVGHYAAAHDWYRQVYDPDKPEVDRFFFGINQFSDPTIQRTDFSWLRDSTDLNPTAIAARREGVYLRHTILVIVRNLLDWADHEFSLADPESLDRARELYLLARRTLQAPELGGECFQAIKRLKEAVVEKYHVELAFVSHVHGSIGGLNSIHNSIIIRDTIDRISQVLETETSASSKASRIDSLVRAALLEDKKNSIDPGLGKDWLVRRKFQESAENALLFNQGAQLSGGHRDIPGGDVPISVDHFGEGYPVPKLDDPITIRPDGQPNPKKVDPHIPNQTGNFGQPDGPSVQRPDPFNVTFCVPGNPLLKAMSMQIETSLLKLANGLSIAGELLPPQLLNCGTSMAYMGVLGGQSDQSLPGVQANMWNAVPTEQPRYRYSFLVDKARQYVDVAERLGNAFLLAREKADGAALDLVRARQAVELGDATITLKELSVDEAEDGSKVVALQQGRAIDAQDHWQRNIDGGMMNDKEREGLDQMLESASLQKDIAAVGRGLVAVGVVEVGAGSIVTLVGMGIIPTAVGSPVGLIATASGVGVMAVGGATMLGGYAMTFGAQSAYSATMGNYNLTYASLERRYEEWKFQRTLAEWDVRIAAAQGQVALDHVIVATQEAEIARLSQAHNHEVFEFLLNKFSDVELYEWMCDVLQRNYRMTMQIAATVATLAQRALEFERQEIVKIISGDYWSLAASGASTANLTEAQRNSGLLGAERLLTDLTKLDAYKLQTDKRRLQLSKTISLARLLPSELVHLRGEGTAAFNTLLEWFDADFPGHYLRLIKSVRITILALVPPVDGIHAMLTNPGESSVVVRAWNSRTGKFEFVKKRAARNFGEEIALDSPYNETGLFVLNYDDPMLLPFEGLGVETNWKLDLPHGTNRFNFDSIVDVLFTIEYTALYDLAYADEVRARIGDQASMDTMVDAALSFPDEWYHINNPRWVAGVPHAPQQLKLNLARTLFPPNFLDVPPLNATQLNLIVVGDFNDQDDIKSAIREALRTGITVLKDGAPIRLSSVFYNNYALFFTRTGGMVSREYWTNITGNAVSDIPLTTTPTTTPSGMDILPSLEGPTNWGDNYGSRIRGYITAPSTGNYIFWIASDNHSELWLSNDDTPLNKRKIASVGTSSTVAWTANREWNKFPAQKSAAINLDAGKKYYVEVLHKESTGDDHVEVGWLKPGDVGESPSEIIPGSVLSLFTDGGNNRDGLPANTNPVGDWTIQLDPKVYDPPKVAGVTPRDQKPIIDRINDIVLILTVEGKIKW